MVVAVTFHAPQRLNGGYGMVAVIHFLRRSSRKRIFYQLFHRYNLLTKKIKLLLLLLVMKMMIRGVRSLLLGLTVLFSQTTTAVAQDCFTSTFALLRSQLPDQRPNDVRATYSFCPDQVIEVGLVNRHNVYVLCLWRLSFGYHASQYYH